MSTQQSGSIFDAIGGRSSVSAAVELFYERVTGDELLAPFFEGVDMRRLKGHQAAFLVAALGGPDGYRGRSLAEAHRQLQITDAHFDRVAQHLGDTLASLGVPAEMAGTILGQIAPLRDQVVTGGSTRLAIPTPA